jgi:hypothetical protein
VSDQRAKFSQLGIGDHLPNVRLAIAAANGCYLRADLLKLIQVVTDSPYLQSRDRVSECALCERTDQFEVRRAEF